MSSFKVGLLDGTLFESPYSPYPEYRVRQEHAWKFFCLRINPSPPEALSNPTQAPSSQDVVVIHGPIEECAKSSTVSESEFSSLIRVISSGSVDIVRVKAAAAQSSHY